jgi:Mrp family chromosome partitioning ATPase
MANSAKRDDPVSKDSQITHVIAVASGIRGVGKSSIAGLLAAALCRYGLRVGLLDADITSASIPGMFGVHRHPAVIGSEGFVPVESLGGIKLIALNWLLSGEDSRARPDPPISRVIEQFWRDIACGHLDYLIIDLPPGISDIALTAAQSLPLDGVVLITSPRDIAEIALREVANMFKHSGIPLIGLVDNMRHVVCPACGTGIYVFGTGQAEFSAQLFKTEMLGRMPLDPELACLCDAGAIEDYRSAELDSIVEKVLQFVATAVSETSGISRSADNSGGR